MKHLLGGQIGLEDFIFAHRKGKIINVTYFDKRRLLQNMSVNFSLAYYDNIPLYHPTKSIKFTLVF